jgi:WD40 repeat protein/serine/threonine protein kinase
MNTAKQAAHAPHEEAESSAQVHPVEALAEEFLRRYRQGERPSLAEYLERYPELAEQIRAVFPALIAVEQLKPASANASAAADAAAALGPLGGRERIGAYRLLRVLGRGGMGVVYEAEHESLGRRVALKVLPVDAARDAKLLARFQRESRAAAQLHHSNIVPVFEVGQEGDIFFYAMQYIQGQPVDGVIQELQRLRAASGGAPVPEASAVARSLLTGQYEPARSVDATVDAEPSPGVVPIADVPALMALSGQSELSMVESNYRLFCRNVARLGLQVAEALAYAHGRGIVHRDIKPSNLLLDTAGLAWVSDFGLAKTQEHALTETGDLVGTIRYMAPERFQGVCDARADVYALGLTLYELLLLRPAFDAPDRLRLIDQIGHQEPARLRVVDPRIPRDLETILMKAIEKEPRRRYPSAEALAGDLRRFLADEPILARRIGPVERLGRWGRRNPLVAGLSAAVILVTAVGFAGVFGQMQLAVAHELEAQENAKQAQKNEQEANQKRDEVQALNEKLQRTLYASDMNLAQHAWETGSIGYARELLERHRPKPGETDLRNFEWNYLDRLCHAEIFTLNGGGMSVAYSPDGKRLATGSKVWDAQTGQELLTLKGAGRNAAFSPDGKRLASAADGTVKIWDAQTGQELLSFKGDGGSVTFSPDGKRLASASRDQIVRVWDAQTGQELLTLKGAGRNVAFSPDGKRLASADRDDTVKVWDAQTGQELLTLKDTGDNVAFSPNGKLLAIGTGGGLVKLLDAQTGQEILSLKGHRGQINSIAFSPDGTRLASAGRDQIVRVWDARSGQELLTCKGHTGMIFTIVFSPDGKRLASASRDNAVKVWDATTSPEARTLGGPNSGLWFLVFSPDGKRLAGAGGPWGTGEVKVCDARTGREILSLKGGIGQAAFSPDGKRLASASRDHAVKVWDAQTGQEILTCNGRSDGVWSVVYSPDGKRLASIARGGEIKVWDAQTGRELFSRKNPGNKSLVAFSPDGKRLASVGDNQREQGPIDLKRIPVAEVKVWDAQTGQELLSWKVNSGAPSGPRLAFSPDGKRLATSSRPPNVSGPQGPGEVKVWDTQTGQELLTLTGHPDPISGLAFSPDGKRLVSASLDSTVKVWDAQAGQELLNLKVGGHVNTLAFSPDGHWLASDPNGTVTIWDATPLPPKP